MGGVDGWTDGWIDEWKLGACDTYPSFPVPASLLDAGKANGSAKPAFRVNQPFVSFGK